MGMAEAGALRVPGWMVDDPQYASSLYLLESLWPDDRLLARMRGYGTDELSIDFYELLADTTWSSSQRLIIALAAGLFGAALPPPGDSLGHAVECLDDRQLDRVLHAVQIRRKRMLLAEAFDGVSTATRCREIGRELLEMWDELHVAGDAGLDIDMLNLGHRLAHIDPADFVPVAAS